MEVKQENIFFTEENEGIYTSYLSLYEESKIPMFETNLKKVSMVVIDLLKTHEKKIIAAESFIGNMGAIVASDALSYLIPILMDIFDKAKVDGIYFKALASMTDGEKAISYVYDSYIKNNIYVSDEYYNLIDEAILIIFGVMLHYKESEDSNDDIDNFLLEMTVNGIFGEKSVKACSDYYSGKLNWDKLNKIMKEK